MDDGLLKPSAAAAAATRRKWYGAWRSLKRLSGESTDAGLGTSLEETDNAECELPAANRVQHIVVASKPNERRLSLAECRHRKPSLSLDYDFLTRKLSISNKLKLFRKQNSINSDDQKVEIEDEVDPVYLFLKQAKIMSRSGNYRVGSPHVPDIVTDQLFECADDSPDVPSPHSSASTSNYGSQSQLAPPLLRAGNRLSPSTNSHLRHSFRHSAPHLAKLKSSSIDSQSSDHSEPPCVGRAPKLTSQMKSLSLDHNDAAVPYFPLSKCTNAKSHSPLLSSRARNMRQLMRQKNSVETPDGVGSNASMSANVSPNAGSVVSVAAHYVVMRDFLARSDDEIDLHRGELIAVHNQENTEYWQGTSFTGQRGYFPSNCVAPIAARERVMQVLDNLELCEGAKTLRLHKHQIVFRLPEDAAIEMIKIRTEDQYRALCPAKYLASINFLHSR